MAQTLFERQDVIFELLKRKCEKNIKGLEVADELKTLLIILETQQGCIDETEDYIGSDDFHEVEALIKSLKLNLIMKISNL